MSDAPVPPDAPPAAPDAGPAPAGPFGALAGVFTDPPAAFAGLVARPTWWLPFVLWLCAVVLSILVATPKIDMEATIREAIERRAEKTGATVSPEQVRVQAEAAKKFGMLAVPFGALFTGALFFATAGLLHGAGRAFGGEMRFGQTLAVYAHANVANVVGALVSIPIFLTKADASMTQKAAQHAVMSNLAAFAPESAPPALVSVLASIDVFSLAALALLVVGFRKLPALSKGLATWIPIGLWIAYVVVRAGWVALFA